MKREFLVNLIFLFGINLLVKPIYLFGIERGVQNILPPGEYGVWFALFNFTFLFQIINDFGLRIFTNRQVAQNRHMVGHYLPNLLVLKGMLGVSYLLIVLISSLLIGYPYSLLPLVGLVAFNQLLSSLSLYLRANLAGLGMYKVDSLLSAGDKLLMIGLLAVFIWGPPAMQAQLTLWHFVGAQTLSWFSIVLAAFLILAYRAGPFQTHWKWKRISMLLRRSAPYALAIFLMTVYTRIDGVMIERLLPNGPLQADIYASAYRLLDAANAFGFLFAALLLPMFANLLKRKEQIAPLIRFSIQLLWSVIFPLTAACIAFNQPIMEGLYRSGSAYSGQVLALLIFSLVAMSGNYVYSTLLTAQGRLGSMNRIFVGTVLANILLNGLLIPSHQALGAAAATCLTQFASFFLQLRLAVKCSNLNTDYHLVIRLVSFAIICGCFGWLWSSYWQGFWLFGFLGTLFLSGGTAFVLGLTDLSTFKELVFQKLNARSNQPNE